MCRRIFWPFFLLFGTALSFAQAATNASPSSSALPASADNSKEAVVVERYTTHLEYQDDGTGTREVTAVIRVQSEAGVQNLGVLRFPYTSANDAVDVDYVRVRKPDGKVVATPEPNIQDMPADVTRVAPMYSDIHEKHVTVKALSAGDVLEYQVRFRTIKPQVPGQFWYEHAFYKGNIVQDEELEISAPKDKYVKVSSPNLQPQVKEEDGRRIYRWKTEYLKREEDSEQRPRREGPQPDVQLTTFHSWEEVGRWYGELQKPQVAVTPELRAKAAEITKGLTSDSSKLHALYDFVSTRVHYISLSFGVGRYQPHTAEEVLGNEYGDCKDKHTLLAALLKASGYDAWPALINASRHIDADLPSPGQFNHVITVVPLGKEMVWLDTTPEVAPFGLLLAVLRDKQALVMASEKSPLVMKTPKAPLFALSITFLAEGKLDAEGTMNAHMERSSRGDEEVLLRAAFRQTPQGQWKNLVQRISYAGGFGGEVSNVVASRPEDLEEPFHFSYDYTRKKYSDWENRRIGAPLPFLGIESNKDDEKVPAEPILLGSPGEVVYKAKVQLPAGYVPELPEKASIKEDFAEYRSEYAFTNGVFTAERRLLIKNPKGEVPLEGWKPYLKFRKVANDDWATLIPLTSEEGKGATSAQADKLFREGVDALRRNDAAGAEEAFRRLIELDPKYPGAHANLGSSYLARRNLSGGMDELRKEQELHPEDPFSYRVLAELLWFQHKKDEAIEQWRKLLKVEPKDRDAALSLSRALIAKEEYGKAVEVLEESAKQSPGSSRLQLALGSAYLKAAQKEKGLAAMKTAVEADPNDSSILNTAAYSLAEADLDLERAGHYSEKAVHNLEAASLKAGSDEEKLANSMQLAANWDTLGWVYFKQGSYDKAVRYLRAAWKLMQNTTVGDHLAQTYERQGKKQEAAHHYQLALAAATLSGSQDQGPSTEEIRKRYERLTGKKADPGPIAWHRGQIGPLSPLDELTQMRSVRLTSEKRQHSNATFTISFVPGKVGDVVYVSGDDTLKGMAESIRTAKFNFEFPDPEPTKLVRRGILSCGLTGCQFVLMLPNAPYFEQ